MRKVKAWISAARLRTLPLSVSGIIVGSSLISNDFLNLKLTSALHSNISQLNVDFYQSIIFWLAIATTLGLQILSNFANDYGDGVKGTDNEDRIGPERAIQSGVISKKEMKIGIIINVLINLVLAISLIYCAFGKEQFLYTSFFLLLGILSIIAAIKYTVGKSAYGYRGLGDLFVFIFFGIVSVLGSYFLQIQYLDWLLLLPASSIGLLCTAVLNLNNLRDYENDKKSLKNTLVVKIGMKAAVIYHFIIVLLGMLCLLIFAFITYTKPFDFLFIIGFIPLILHIKNCFKINENKGFDPELKKVALSTFFISLLFCCSQII